MIDIAKNSFNDEIETGTASEKINPDLDFGEDEWISFDNEEEASFQENRENDWKQDFVKNEEESRSQTSLNDGSDFLNGIDDSIFDENNNLTPTHTDDEFGNEWGFDDNEVSSETIIPKTFEEKLQAYDPQTNINQAGCDYIKQLYTINEDIFETLNQSLLQPKYTENFSFVQFSRIACDKDFQDKLLSLDDNRYQLFVACCKIASARGENWASSTNAIVDGMLNPQFSELVQNAANGSCSDLETLNVVLASDDNYFGIRSLEQVKDYHHIKNSVCRQILTAPEKDENLTDALKNMSPLDRVKFVRCEQEYGISLSQAKLLCQKYGWAILNSDEKIGNEQNHAMLESLTKLIMARTKEDALNVKFAINGEKKQTFGEIDNQFRRCFAEMYNQAFYHPREQDKIGTETINGKQISVYDAGVNFTMCSHVVGAFSDSAEGDESYKDKWNRPLRQSHVFCTRLIANDALEIAKENSVCYGFTQFDTDALIASAPWDMASITFNVMFDTAGEMDKKKSMRNCEGSGARFLSPREQINNTRTDGNETNWDRFDSTGQKKQPNYLIYIADSLNSSEFKSSKSYKETLKAASQFDIPLVVIDRAKVINNEHYQINKMIDDYSQTHDFHTLEHIIQKFENNRTTGFWQSSEDTYKKEFPLLTAKDGKFKSLQEITCELLEINPEHAQEIVDILSREAIKSHNKDQEFCDIIYDIKDKFPSVNVDLDMHLKNQWGITQKKTSPRKISSCLYKSFYNKKEEENTKTSKEKMDNKIAEIKEKLKKKNETTIGNRTYATLQQQQLRGTVGKEISSSEVLHVPPTVSEEILQSLHVSKLNDKI